jgi:cobalamin biosynthetic protein CobC
MIEVGSMASSGMGEAIAHGGRLSQARDMFPGAPEPFIDLSTGINPVPYEMPSLPVACFTRLPEPEDVEALQSVAATAYGLRASSMVVAAPGTQILIDLLPRFLSLRSVAILGPTYGEYQNAWARVGCHVDEVTDMSELKDTDGVVLCNPNNPDGRRIDRARLLAVADQLASRPDGLLIVDEAFADLEGSDISLAAALPHPGLVVLRSFGKTYGLGGLRLGFALASSGRAAAIRAALGPWAVSGPAIEVGRRALANRAWLARTRERLIKATAELDQLLQDAGMRVIGGTCLFRLAETEAAGEVFEKLGRAGILVRRFAQHPTWLRFGQPADTGEWERFREALVR